MNWIKQTYHHVNELSSTAKKQKQFGLLFAGILLAICAFSIYKNNAFTLAIYLCSGISIALINIVLFAPKLLKWPLLVWLYLGKILGEITSTVVLAILYFFIFTPITALNRLFSKKSTMQKNWVERKNTIIDYKKLY